MLQNTDKQKVNPLYIIPAIFILAVAFMAFEVWPQPKADASVDSTLVALQQLLTTQQAFYDNEQQNLKQKQEAVKIAQNSVDSAAKDRCSAWKALKGYKEFKKMPLGSSDFCAGVVQDQPVAFIPVAQAESVVFQDNNGLDKPKDNTQKPIVKSESPKIASISQVKPAFYQKKDVGQDENQYVKLASLISNNNLDFITTLESENGLWTIDRKSPKNSDGSRDFGLCQLNSAIHSTFIKSADFKDPKKQIQKCWEIFQGRPTAFYGYYLRKNHTNKFYLTF